MVTRWKFYDPSTLVEDTIFLNPQELRLPDRQKTTTEETTTAGGAEGRTIVFEGADRVPAMGWSGVTFTLAQKAWLEELWAKRRQIRLTDDFEQVWWIYITKLSFTRPRTKPSHPERHDYTLDAIILDWPT